MAQTPQTRAVRYYQHERNPMDLFLKFLAYGGPAAMGVMGYVVIDRPPKTQLAKRCWYAAFIFVAVVSVGSAVWDSKKSQSEIAAMLTGGDNYCYYRAEIHNPSDLTAKLPLWIKCTGPLYNLNSWFSPWEAKGDPNNPLYWSLKTGQHFTEIIPGGFISGLTLPAGAYRIEMSARNGTVIEMLEIKVDNEKLDQSILVFLPSGERLHLTN
jgi:hypothetical protein